MIIIGRVKTWSVKVSVDWMTLKDPKVCIRNYFQGGTKLLVVLSWNAMENTHANKTNEGKRYILPSSADVPIHCHEVLFNGIPVPTAEIQPGVLRCTCPGKSFLNL